MRINVASPISRKAVRWSAPDVRGRRADPLLAGVMASGDLRASALMSSSRLLLDRGAPQPGKDADDHHRQAGEDQARSRQPALRERSLTTRLRCHHTSRRALAPPGRGPPKPRWPGNGHRSGASGRSRPGIRDLSMVEIVTCCRLRRLTQREVIRGGIWRRSRCSVPVLRPEIRYFRLDSFRGSGDMALHPAFRRLRRLTCRSD
jgi:hypothetical protein